MKYIITTTCTLTRTYEADTKPDILEWEKWTLIKENCTDEQIAKVEEKKPCTQD